MLKKKEEKTIYIDVEVEMHCEIKRRASIRNVSIKTWVLRAIQVAILEEDKHK